MLPIWVDEATEKFPPKSDISANNRDSGPETLVTDSTTSAAAPTMSDRVASNAAIGLVEVVITSLISIFYVRLLLQALGVVDYGIFTALGASGLLSVIVVGGFNTAALRYLALAAGGDDDKLRRTTMASTTALYLCIAVVLFITAAAISGFLLDRLQIPDDRLGAATAVYWSVVGQFCLGAITAPFAAARQAHQRFGLLSVADVGQRVLVLLFLIALSLRPAISNDALRSVALVAFIGAAIRVLLVVGRTLQELPASHFKFRDASLEQIRSMARFARWSILNSISVQGRNQFAVLIMNVGFGTIVNAAYAIGLSTNAMMQRFSRAFNKSLQPAVTSLYGSDKDRDLAGLISVGCRYAAIVSVAPLAAVLVEMEHFLDLWLDDAPPNAPLYAQLISIGTFTRLVSSGYGSAINATDRMRAGTLLGVGVDTITITAGVLAIFVFDTPPWSLPVIIIIGSLIRNIVFVSYFGPLYGLRLGRWFREVIVPVVSSLLIVLGCVWAVTRIMDPSLFRLALAGLTSVAATAACIRWIVSTRDERAMLMQWLSRSSKWRS